MRAVCWYSVGLGSFCGVPIDVGCCPYERSAKCLFKRIVRFPYRLAGHMFLVHNSPIVLFVLRITITSLVR